ncbi:hypothetical protein [Photobacterium sp. TY1-4]|uniref:hypothetical protein n=1 Tax=Photobacterium sp. TY1-4 TaxID=2899122 RepID=UPI0021C09B10|nr:hypothetical protein [Photobacterium sp. TY1-4]UXI04241.1 hypothetical protein NH461_19275 [Photobacterium sp. TY1-4]
MDSSSILTMLGLVVAIYAIIPRESKLDLNIRISTVDKIVILFSLITVHYIMFYPVLNNMGLKVNFGPWLWGFDQKNTTYLIFLCLSLYLYFKIKHAKISSKNIGKLAELVEQLIIDKKFAEASVLIERSIGGIEKIDERTSFRNWLSKKIRPQDEFSYFLGSEVKSDGYFKKKYSRQFKLMADKIRKNDESKEIASALIIRVFNDKSFIKYLSISKPYFLLSVLKRKTICGEQPLKLFIYSLIEDLGSVYYFEFENNQNLLTRHRYYLSPSNQFLNGIFSDCNICKDLAIYKPVGDKVCDLIDYDRKLVCKYNESLGNYYESHKFQCPVYTGIQFFNVMILESMHQGIQWHMWLYYYQSFTKKILKNMNPDSSVDESTEWPTPFHFHLYTMITNCLDWIYECQDIDGGSAFKFNGVSLTHDNSSILKSSALCLGNMIYSIVSSSKISNDFKVYIIEIVLREIENNKHDVRFSDIHHVMMKSILFNGFHNKRDINYLTSFKVLYDDVDHMIKFELKDFDELLNSSIDACEKA